MRKIIPLIVVASLGPHVVAAAVLRPVDVSQFCVTPGESVKLQWRIEQGELAGSAEYTVRDYWGHRVATGTGGTPLFSSTRRRGIPCPKHQRVRPPGRFRSPQALRPCCAASQAASTAKPFGVVTNHAAAC